MICIRYILMSSITYLHAASKRGLCKMYGKGSYKTPAQILSNAPITTIPTTSSANTSLMCGSVTVWPWLSSLSLILSFQFVSLSQFQPLWRFQSPEGLCCSGLFWLCSAWRVLTHPLKPRSGFLLCDVFAGLQSHGWVPSPSCHLCTLCTVPSDNKNGIFFPEGQTTNLGLGGRSKKYSGILLMNLSCDNNRSICIVRWLWANACKALRCIPGSLYALGLC